MEHHHFEWENPLLMAIFNSYVKLPEGTYWVFLGEKTVTDDATHGEIPSEATTGGTRTLPV